MGLEDRMIRFPTHHTPPIVTGRGNQEFWRCRRNPFRTNKLGVSGESASLRLIRFLGMLWIGVLIAFGVRNRR